MLFVCLCIVIDGHNAYFTVLWDFISVPSVRHCRSFLHGRHRRGGQSAARFQRRRQGAEDAYLKRILDIVRESGHTFKDFVLGGSHHLCHKLLDLMKHPSPLFVSTSEPASTGCLYKLVRLWRESKASQGRISGSQMEASKRKHGGVCLEHLVKIWNPGALLALGSDSLFTLVLSGIDPLYIIGVARKSLVTVYNVPACHMLATRFGLTCTVCSSPAIYTCPCRLIRYCSRRCQKSHWLCHRVICTATFSRSKKMLLSSLCLSSAPDARRLSFWRSLRASCS